MAEQARHRAVSIAAEASLQRKQVEAIRKQQNIGNEEGSADSAPQPVMPHPPFLASMDILTPTPVAPPITSQNSPIMGEGRGVALAAAAQSGSSSGEGDSSTSLIEDEAQPEGKGSEQNKTSNVFKSLGNWSIKEFEGDAMDPFEIASLQAINDMEELQSVLQPTQAPPAAATIAAVASASSSSSASSPAVQGTSRSTPAMIVSSQSQVLAVSHPSAAAVQSSPMVGTLPTSTTGTAVHLPVGGGPNQATPSSSGLLRGVVSSTADLAITGTPPSTSSPLAQNNFSAASHEARSMAVSTNPFLPGPSVSAAAMTSTNPFLSSEPAQNHVPFITPVSGIASTPNLQQQSQPQPQQQSQQQQLQQSQEPQRGRSEPGVGTLVDLGPGGIGAMPVPVPAPRNSPKVQASCNRTHYNSGC